jgi:hypothetical protein
MAAKRAVIFIALLPCGWREAQYKLIDYDSLDWEKDPAYSRGWIVQEHLLSARVLNFTSVWVHFRCASSFSTDANVLHTVETEKYDAITAGLAIIDRNTPGSESAGVDWSWAVEKYTKRSLSVPSDKLNAISAVARWCYDKSPSRYLASLWERDLLDTLVWQLDPEVAPLLRPTAYRAPSWSWASVDGAVSMDARASDQLNGLKPSVAIVHCTVESKHPTHSFGEVASATLVLRAPIISAKRFYCREELQVKDYAKTATKASIQQDVLEKDWPISDDTWRNVELLEIFAQTSVYASRGLIIVQDEHTGEHSRVSYFAFQSRKKSYFRNAPVKEITIV